MAEATGVGWLSSVLLCPLVGAVLAAALGRSPWVPRVALAAAMLTLCCSLYLVARIDWQDADFQFVESVAWIPAIGVRYLVGVDGLSILFLPATAILFCGAVLASWRVDLDRPASPGLYFALLLLLEAATLGIFCALDVVLFFACWEFTLLPLYFLTSLWGDGNGRQAAAHRYFLLMLAGSVPLLLGFLTLSLGHAGQTAPTFDVPSLLETPLARSRQFAVFLLLLIGFGVKVPLVPLHTWLPQIAVTTPAAVTASLVGLKVGAYGLIRFAIPLAPMAAEELHWLLAGLGTLAILYGSVAAIVQSNLRSMLAYASVAHVGLVVLGLSSFSVSALQGALLQLLSFSVSAGGGFLALSFLRRRTGSTDVAHLGGVMGSMPLLTGFFLFFGLAGLGLPLTSGFPGELLILVAALHAHTGAGLAALFGTVVGAAAFLMPFREAFLGPIRNPEVAVAADLLPRELACLALPAFLVLAVGVYPMPLLELFRPAAEAWVTGLVGL